MKQATAVLEVEQVRLKRSQKRVNHYQLNIQCVESRARTEIPSPSIFANKQRLKI